MWPCIVHRASSSCRMLQVRARLRTSSLGSRSLPPSAAELPRTPNTDDDGGHPKVRGPNAGRPTRHPQEEEPAWTGPGHRSPVNVGRSMFDLNGGQRMANGTAGRPSIHAPMRPRIHASTRPCMEADVAQVRRPAPGVRRLEYKPPRVRGRNMASDLGARRCIRGS